jgi:hypothetical protein
MASQTSRKGKAQAQEESASQGSLLSLWAGVLLAPLAFLSALQANYTLTQKLCPGGRMSLLHLATLLFLLITATGILIAWRNWQRAGKGVPDESEERQSWERFMGVVGMLISALSFLLIVAQLIPQFFFNPCQR